MIDYEIYENLPPQYKWMAHATMSATAFFLLWKRKFEKLVWDGSLQPQRGIRYCAMVWLCFDTSGRRRHARLR